ncbi:MAG: substrate-binding domain-containing protein, partial [Verrucomicrobiota bacterium]
WDGFDWSKFSVVRFGLSVPQPDANVVTSDAYRATVMATGKINEYGYRRIGLVVNGEFDQRVGGNWSSGFYYAQRLLGLKSKLPPLLTFLKTRTAEEFVLQKAVLEVWLKEHRPDALLISDREVPGMLIALGYRVPHDIALAGMTVWDIPGVDAGIDQHSQAIGRTAAETLVKQLNVNERGEPRDPVRILIESRWQDGKSLPPLAGRKIRFSARSEPRPLPWVSARKRVTLKEIADRIGVSKNTVSLALRGNSRISLATKERIDATARELGYVADPILQRLAAYRRGDTSTKLRGLIAWLNHWNEPKQLRSYHEFESYWRGAGLAARRLGYRLEEFIWPASCPAQRAEQLLRERKVLGLLIPPHKPDLDWGDFDWSQFSLIRFGMSVQQVDSNLVTADHQRAILMAVRRIHAYGYERIALIYDANHDRSMGGNLFGGFTCAMNQAALKPGIPALDFNVQQFDENCGAQVLKEWMLAHRPQAIITTAPQVPVLLRKLGYRIPCDVAVAGTSVQDISVEAGIDQRSHAIGQIAAEMLIKQISLNERGEPADPCRILVESRWRDGKSLPPR